MKIPYGSSYRRRRAVTSVLGAVIMFAMLFTVLFGFLIYANQTALSSTQANAGRQAALQQASAENLVLGVRFAAALDPWGQIGDLWLTVNNTGSASATIVEVYVTNATNVQLVSNSQVSPTSHYLSVKGTPAQMGDLSVNLPLSVTMSASTRTMTSCAGAYGCDIAISQKSYLYVPGATVLVSVLTSSGNVFSVQYPIVIAGSASGFGSNPLVVKMLAQPPQTLSCPPSCVTDTITVYNYATTAVTGVAPSPSPPTAQVTGTASIYGGSCGAAVPSSTIPAYSGVGIPSSIVITCTYGADTGAVGGFASFSGRATGTLGGVSISSAQEVSNGIQIGGTVSVLNQGPFSANSFFFKDSYCLQSKGQFWVSPCAMTPNPLTIANLPNANPQNGSADYYVAYYVQVTNNFNTTLALLQYSYFQTDPTQGGESDFYVVGPASQYASSGYYFPDYSKNTPVLAAYGGDATTCAETPPSFTPPPSANCIDIAPGQTMTLTFAACRAGSSDWNWGDSQYGRAFDNPVGCSPQAPPNYQTPEATYLSIILSFMYNGQIYDQQIPFQGETILGGASNSLASCSIGNYCGTVFYTQYTGSVAYFNFVYSPATSTFSIPTPPFVINNALPKGSDGVVFNPQDHKIITGTNVNPYTNFNEVNPNTGAATTYPSTQQSYNVFVDATGTTLWMNGDACPGCTAIASAPLVGGIGAATTLPLSGNDLNINSMMFVDTTHVYYTAELGPRFQGQTGHVGSIDLTTGVTTCFKTAGVCTVFNGVHGGVYDPFTNNLIVFGWNQINQIDRNSGALVASETVAALNPAGGANFDQGAVDGFGHLFISWASNTGELYFEDYSGGTVGAANFHVITNGGLNNLGATAFNNIDDLAPIVGPGSQG